MFQTQAFPFPGEGGGLAGGMDPTGMGMMMQPNLMGQQQQQPTTPMMMMPGDPYGGLGMEPQQQQGMPQQSMMMMMPQQDAQGRLQLSRINLNPFEVPLFQQLWTVANTQGLPTLPGQQAAEFLRLSGLPRPTLHQIWTLSDANNEGSLGFEEFCIALRLIAHAQNGLMVAPEMINEEPFSLPHLDLTQQPYSSVSDASSMTGMMMPPLGSSMDPNAAAAAMAGSGMPSSGLSPSHFISSESLPPGQLSPFFISEADRQKYFTILQRLPLDMDGCLSGDEARNVMGRSGLSESDLFQIWMLADQDGDGRLNPAEFVVAMHLVGVTRKGHPVPQILPSEFHPVLMNQPLPQAPMELPSPPLSPSGGAGGDQWGVAPLGGEGFPPLGQPEELPKTEGFGDTFDFPEPPISPETKKKKTKKKAADEISFGDLVEKTRREEESEGSEEGGRVRLPSRPKSRRTPTRDEESETREFEETTSRIKKTKDSKQIIKEAIEADRQLSKSVSKSVDALAEELSQLTDMSSALKAELVKEKKDLKRQLDRRREFETEISELKLELESIQEERRKIDHEKVSVARDLDHYQNEMLFLKRQLEETEKDIVLLQDSNLAIEKNLKHTENQTRQLDIARKTAMGRIEAEKEMLKEQEKEIAEMRSTLDRMRRDKEDAQSKYAILQEKLRQADQDRGMLLHSVESERIKLAGLQTDRMDASDEKARLAKLMVEADQDWVSVTKPVGFRETSEASVYYSVGTGSRLPRDSKGVPSGAGSTSLTPVYPHGKVTRGDMRSCESSPQAAQAQSASDFRAQFTSMGSPLQPSTQWTSFGGGGGLTSSQFASVGGALLAERRGIDRISRELTSGGDALSTDFLASKESSRIGTRKAERSDFSIIGRGDKGSQASSIESDGEKKKKTRRRKDEEEEEAPIPSPKPLKRKKKLTGKKSPKRDFDTSGGDSTAGFGSDWT